MRRLPLRMLLGRLRLRMLLGRLRLRMRLLVRRLRLWLGLPPVRVLRLLLGLVLGLVRLWLVVPRAIRRLLVGLLAVRVLLRVRIAPSPAGARGLHDAASMPETRPDSILLA
ncbi:hypothetical protein DZF91_13915 [Actinomadura logoneensis]|uniref:Uncharacterized protein n=2 Tax=Actinomadura logoneensis TaxID=2293572 RepID=A0A372JM82_9ACTN|nr:hypothetical protein DZF91_13915 [Actinomadura logoneensis]